MRSSLLAFVVTFASVVVYAADAPNSSEGAKMTNEVQKSEAEWRKILTPEQYRILRLKDTERAFTGAYWNSHEKGVYRCAGCGAELFSSQTKFDSGCGWPSFFASLKDTVRTKPDYSHGMNRIEVLCARCGGHLGHVFDDGPNPTGKRFCINSASLKLDVQKSLDANNQKEAPPKK